MNTGIGCYRNFDHFLKGGCLSSSEIGQRAESGYFDRPNSSGARIDRKLNSVSANNLLDLSPSMSRTQSTLPSTINSRLNAPPPGQKKPASPSQLKKAFAIEMNRKKNSQTNLSITNSINDYQPKQSSLSMGKKSSIPLMPMSNNSSTSTSANINPNPKIIQEKLNIVVS